MKVLLAGGAGYIGSHTAVALVENGHEPIIVDNLYNSSMEVVHRLEQICGVKIPFINAEITDNESMDRIFQEYKPECVIHFASLKAVGESVEKPLEYYRNNLDTTFTLLEVMKKHHVTQFVFSSSATVYGNNNPMPLSEDMPTSCTNPYGWTKYMNERILIDIATADPSLSVLLLRYFNPIGAHKSGLIGEHPNGIPNNLFPYILQVACGKRTHLNVLGNDYPTSDGTGVRDYIHVMDLAEGHVAGVNWLADHPGVEIINLGTGHGFSVLDLVHTFENVTGVPVPYKITDRRPGDVSTCYATAQKAKSLLNWTTTRSLEDMCRDGWRWQKNNPNGYDID